MPPNSDPQQLLQAFVDFAQATNWSQAKRVLEQHPELLGDEVDTLLDQLAAAQESKEDREFLETYRALLQRCRTVGMEVAFAEIERASLPAIPAEFHEDFRYAYEAEQRYQSTGRLTALDTAINAWERILTNAAFSATLLTFQLIVLNKVSETYLSRYLAKDELSDLERSLDLCQKALVAAPPDAPSRAASLTILGNGLRKRYERIGQFADLEAAINAYQQAIDATPPDSLDRAVCLNNLGNGLRKRYERIGQFADLEAAINAYQQAVDATPPDAPIRAGCLISLGNGLSKRYERSGQLADLEAAINAYQQAIDATPPDSLDRVGYLNNLGNGLLHHYKRSGQLADLEAAIDAYQQAVDTTWPADTPSRSGFLINLGNSLQERYERIGQFADLEAAINAYQQAVDATPPDAPDRALFLSCLGNGLGERYARSHQLADLEAAINANRQAVDATPPDAPSRAGRLINLGTGLSNRYTHSRHLADLEAAQSAYRSACKFGLETALEAALHSARNWGNWALERHAWEEAAEAYDYGTKAVDRLFETQLLRSAKESWLREVQGLAANAAYALARTGNLERAVEAVEGRRARLLAEALERNRHDLEQLSARGHGELLARYRQAAARWAALTAETERPNEAPRPDATAWRGALAEARAELDAVVQAVRQVPGYADFLRAPTFMHIRAAAREAPLVYLMATPAGGLALILSPVAQDAAGSGASGVQAVWLDALTDAAVREQLYGPEDTPELGGYLGAYARWRAEPRNPETRAHWFGTLETTTRWL